MITFKRALEIHSILIDYFGGTLGVRDHSLLQSVLNCPYQTSNQIELYPTAVEKSAVIIESIITNHPFIDGNKRTGYVLARLTLMKDQLDLIAELEEKYWLIMKISAGELEYDQIRRWIQAHIK